MKRIALSLVAVVILFCYVTPARATFINSTTGISNPARTITFDEHVFPDRYLLTSEYQDLGVIFSTTLYYNSLPYPAPNQIPPQVENFNTLGGLINPFSIKFTIPQTSAAFSLITNETTTNFIALLNNVEVDSGSTTTSLFQANNFFGFAGIIFDEIKVFVTGNDGVAAIDNIQLSKVPEPITLLFLFSTLTGLVGLARKFKN